MKLVKMKCSSCGTIVRCRENSPAYWNQKCQICHTSGPRFQILQEQINELKMKIEVIEKLIEVIEKLLKETSFKKKAIKKPTIPTITPPSRTRKGRAKIIHLNDEGKYLCNHAVHPTPSKITDERKFVTCKNCKWSMRW